MDHINAIAFFGTIHLVIVFECFFKKIFALKDQNIYSIYFVLFADFAALVALLLGATYFGIKYILVWFGV